MSSILFYNLQSPQEFAEGKTLYLDDSDGFDEDFCASARPGDELRLLQAREPGIPLFRLRYARCEIRKADYSGIEATIISATSLHDLIDKMPAADDFSVSTLMQWAQSYINRAGRSLSELDIDLLPFNLPQKSMLDNVRLQGEIRIDAYNNPYNTLYLQYMSSTGAIRVLYLRNDRQWFNILYDIFHPTDLVREIERHAQQAATTTGKEYWNYFLQ